MSFFSHRRMVKYRESIILVDVFCLEHNLDALSIIFVDVFCLEHDLDAL